MEDKKQIEQVTAEPVEQTENSQITSIEKFKDNEALANAYKALESEFTKKCQELGRVQEDLKSSKERLSAIEHERSNAKEFTAKLEAFEKQNPIAGQYREQLLKELESDEQMRSSPYCLEVALARAMRNQPTAYAKDDILGYINSDEGVRNKIIADYVMSLEQNSLPKTIASSGEPSVTPPLKLTSIKEAGQMAEKLFNIRRIK